MADLFRRIAQRAIGQVRRLEPLVPSRFAKGQELSIDSAWTDRSEDSYRAERQEARDVSSVGQSDLRSTTSGGGGIQEQETMARAPVAETAKDDPLVVPPNASAVDATLSVALWPDHVQSGRVKPASASRSDADDITHSGVKRRGVDGTTLRGAGAAGRPVSSDWGSEAKGTTNVSDELAATQGRSLSSNQSPSETPQHFEPADSLLSAAQAVSIGAARPVNSKSGEIDTLLPPADAIAGDLGFSVRPKRGAVAAIPESPNEISITPIRVTIGRIEVSATMPAETRGRPRPNSKPKRHTTPALSLDSYLRQRDGKSS